MWTRLSIISNHLKAEDFRNSYLSDPINFLNLEDLIPADINFTRKNFRKILEKEVAPVLPEYVESANFPLQVLPFLKPFLGLSEAKYGCKKVSSTEKAFAIYELARIDCSLATFYVLQMSLVIFTIEKLGSEEQKAIYLPGLCSLDKIGAWALTEPEYGSDASSLSTTATPVDGGFLINGSKRWIGNASMSDILIIWARNTKTNQVEGFIVDSKTPGITIKKIERKLSLRIVQNGDISLINVKVSINSRLEKAHNFNIGTNVVLEHSRMSIPWIATGIMAGVYENVIKNVSNRKQFKAPIGSYQLTQEKLVRLLGHYQSSFLLSWRITELLEKGQANIAQASLIKAWTTAVGRDVVRLGREMLGGNGIIIDNYVMKALVDMETVYTYEGTYDINALVAGRAITGIPAFKSQYKRN